METSKALAKSNLFSGLTGPEIEQIRGIGIEKTYEKGELIFSDGQKATGFFVNLSGQVKVYKLSVEGREQILHIIKPPEAFAEAALFAGSTFPAFAEPLTPSRLMFFPKDRFLHLIQTNPQLSLNMIAGLSTLLRHFVDLVEELSLKDVGARLSAYLLDLASRSGQIRGGDRVLDLEVTKTQLASRLGTISETLSRVLRRLQNHNMIRVEGKRIVILDAEALEEIASGLST